MSRKFWENFWTAFCSPLFEIASVLVRFDHVAF